MIVTGQFRSSTAKISSSNWDGPKEFHCVADAGHIDLHMKDTDSYMDRIVTFVQSVRPPAVH